MNFDTYLEQAWTDHGERASMVAESFSLALTLVENNEHLAQLAHLVTHVKGEHLAQWDSGISFLEKMQAHTHFTSGSETEKAILRSKMVLRIGSGADESLKKYSSSDQIRILAVAGSALSNRDVPRAKELLGKALQLAERGLDKADPANRALAVTGNNLACALEEKRNRSTNEIDLMILAAKTGRKYWEIAGTWENVVMGEYRLAMTYLKAGRPAQALDHAKKNLEIQNQNQTSDKNLFFGYQILALSEKQCGNNLVFKTAAEQAKKHYDQLNEDDKKYCASDLQTLFP